MQFGIQLHPDAGADAVLEEARCADEQAAGTFRLWTDEHLVAIDAEGIIDARPER